ncbi:MAG: hypothetical protein CMN56_01285 [Sneathiella sp.]|uniref:hypothetical protein n=1 Tax=Sneathiella sp. TaxID=1964365 RepID=UPI000C382C94|nr:hypothetical protein [Sneathiella sp.]MAZ01748.1 hypothetical protein [Sneathiella sp.]
MKGAILATLILILAACSTSFSQLSVRDQLLLTCDGLATTMGIVKNFILDGTIDNAATLRDIRAASVVAEESCTGDADYAAALSRLSAQSVILLEARHAAEADNGNRS